MGDSSDISQAISVLVNRLFPSTEDKALFQSLKEALASTRKYKKFSDSVILKQLQQWEKFPLQRIHTGIRTYLNKQCHLQGKDEKYLMGIIRNSTSDLINKCPAMKDSAKIPILEGFTCPRCGQELLFKDDLTQGGCVYCSIGKQNNHFERLKND